MAEDKEYAPEPAWYRNPVWMICALLLTLLIVIWGAFALIGHFTKGSNDKPAAAESKETGNGDTDSICGLHGSSRTTISSAPKVHWHSIKAVAAPKSAEAGPGKGTDAASVPSCFAHSPEGAVLAAANYAAAMGDQSMGPKVLEQQGLNSPAKREALSEMSASESSSSTGDSSAAISSADGFKLLSYDKSTAKVQVASSASINGQRHYIMTTHDLRWSDGDWKIEVPDEQDSSSQAGEIPDLDGYMVFGK